MAAGPAPWTIIPPEPYDGDDESLEGGFVYPGGIEDANGDAVCVFGWNGGSGELFENPANPPLISAAPDLLDALLTGRDYVADAAAGALAYEGSGDGFKAMALEDLARIDAAIAKARS